MKSGQFALSLLATPWLVFVTTALHLYVANQDELHNESWVLAPFVAAAMLTWLAALLIGWLRRWIDGGLIVWIYYLAGFGFVVFAVAKPSLSFPFGDAVLIGAIAAVVVALAATLGYRARLPQLIGPLALASIAVIVSDVALAVLELESKPTPTESRAAATEPYRADLPNIYHVVFDEYQTDIFLLALDRSGREFLRGFTFFPDNTTPFGRTGMALPAILTGRTYDFSSPQLEYQMSAFAGERSLLSRLKQLGYRSEAYLHPVYNFRPKLFESVTFHESSAGDYSDAAMPIFLRLWAYRYLPRSVSLRLIGPELIHQFDNQNVLSPVTPVASLSTMRSFIAAEKEKPGGGRYAFLHLILPHFPSVLTADCRYSGERTSPVEQAACANRLMQELVDELSGLDRLDDSIVIFQSDHGSGYKVEAGKLKNLATEGYYSESWSRARSRALLLIKPPNRQQREMELSELQASTVDTAPTLLGMLGATLPEADGVDLFKQTEPLNRVRYYYFYDKKGANEWTDRMVRYRIEPDALVRIGEVPLTNNPRPDA